MRGFIFCIAVLISLAGARAATAQIYKCDGPEGPIYTDKVCGPAAKPVELEETSGLGGVYDDAKAALAKDQAQRAAEREAANSLKRNSTVVNNHYTTLNTEPAGYWLNGPYMRPGYRPRPKPEPRPELRPAPPPATLGRPRR